MNLYVSDHQVVSPLVKYIILCLFSFNIPLIFFISGAINQDHQKSIGDFIIELLKWVIWPYVLWSFFLVCAQNIFLPEPNKAFSFSALINIYYAPISLYWFLYAFMIVRIFNYLTYYIFFEKPVLRSTFCLVAFLLVTFSLVPVSLIHNSLFGYVFFTCGAKLKKAILFIKLHIKHKEIYRFIWASSFILLFSINYINLSLPAGSIENINKFQNTIILTGILAIIFFASIARQILRTKISSALAYVGKYTMSIYVKHMIVLGGITAGLTLSGIILSNNFLEFALLSLCGILIPVLLQKITDRIKITQFMGIRAVKKYL